MKRRSWAFLAAAIGALVLALGTGNDLWFTLTYLLALTLILSFLWAWSNVRWTQLGRKTRSRRAQVGQMLEERFRVSNNSVIPKLWVEVRDESTLPGHRTSRVVSGLGSRKSFIWRINTMCRQRGRFQLGPMSLRSSDPFGLFPMKRQFDVTNTVVVFPHTFPIYDFALPEGTLSGGDALRRRSFQVTTNAAGVRDYAPGDSFGRIHWKSSARRDRLIVKEFELDPLADIWIVPDMQAAAQASLIKPRIGDTDESDWVLFHDDESIQLPGSTEEYIVSIAASVTQYFLRRDRAVGLLAHGQVHEVIQPDRSERQLNRILETLAVLRANGELPLPDLLLAESQALQRGTTIVAITPTTDGRWSLTARELARRGMRLVTILVDPATFGGEASAEPVLALLQGAGLTSHLIKYGDDLTSKLSRHRR